MNPCHYVFISGMNPKPVKKAAGTEKDGYEVRRPFWSYMRKRSVPQYRIENDQDVDV
jgi:hypothetical protein